MARVALSVCSFSLASASLAAALAFSILRRTLAILIVDAETLYGVAFIGVGDRTLPQRIIRSGRMWLLVDFLSGRLGFFFFPRPPSLRDSALQSKNGLLQRSPLGQENSLGKKPKRRQDALSRTVIIRAAPHRFRYFSFLRCENQVGAAETRRGTATLLPE